jgi:hypothetical protein
LGIVNVIEAVPLGVTGVTEKKPPPPSFQS